MTARTSQGTLGPFVENWKPGETCKEDTLPCERARQLAATLDIREVLKIGDPLPPLWQWIYFGEWLPTAELGADGHPRDGHYLPPIPHRRRMFAGGRLTMNAPLFLGRPTERRSTVQSVAAKKGSAGELLFITLRHEYRQEDVVCAAEEQDLVYRSAEAGSVAAPSRRTDMVPLNTSAPWSAKPIINPPLLFRFSALTANAHRIHYDSDYATGTEGFPALVVHGPLLALYMAELLRANVNGRILRSFEFRLRKPVFVDEQICVEGTPAGDTVELAVVGGGGVRATAKGLLGCAD